MKSLQQVYDRVIADEKLKAEMAEIKTAEALEAFAEKLGCSATAEEIKSFLIEKAENSGEISDAELADVSGGTSMISSMIFQFLCS